MAMKTPPSRWACVFSVKVKVFVISGVLAALAGVLYAFVYSTSYLGPEEFNLMFSVQLLIMVVIGGMGSVWGGLAGAVVLTGLHELITQWARNSARPIWRNTSSSSSVSSWCSSSSSRATG